MKITLSLADSLERNAGHYFELAKKFRKKALGAQEAVVLLEKKSQEESVKRRSAVAPRRKAHWYEEYRWFFSSEGFLCVGGKSATSNDTLVKKYLETEDLVFHTSMPGSPFFIIKTGKAFRSQDSGGDEQVDDDRPGDATLQEAATATVTFSRAWQKQLQSVEVYYVHPDQLSKTPQSGEYIAKGAFIVRGKRTFVSATVDLALGKDAQGRVVAGPSSAVRAHCASWAQVTQGSNKASDLAKHFARSFRVHVDDVLRVLPAGSFMLPRDQDWHHAPEQDSS